MTQLLGTLLVLAAYGVAVCWPVARILRRLGFSTGGAVLALLPFTYLIGLWLIAYARWPRAERG